MLKEYIIPLNTQNTTIDCTGGDPAYENKYYTFNFKDDPTEYLSITFDNKDKNISDAVYFTDYIYRCPYTTNLYVELSEGKIEDETVLWVPSLYDKETAKKVSNLPEDLTLYDYYAIKDLKTGKIYVTNGLAYTLYKLIKDKPYTLIGNIDTVNLHLTTETEDLHIVQIDSVFDGLDLFSVMLKGYDHYKNWLENEVWKQKVFIFTKTGCEITTTTKPPKNKATLKDDVMTVYTWFNPFYDNYPYSCAENYYENMLHLVNLVPDDKYLTFTLEEDSYFHPKLHDKKPDYKEPLESAGVYVINHKYITTSLQDVDCANLHHHGKRVHHNKENVIITPTLFNAQAWMFRHTEEPPFGTTPEEVDAWLLDDDEYACVLKR